MKHMKILWVRPSIGGSVAGLFDFVGVLRPRRVDVEREDAVTEAWQMVGGCLRQAVAMEERTSANG